VHTLIDEREEEEEEDDDDDDNDDDDRHLGVMTLLHCYITNKSAVKLPAT
jgi:hypothetical protein